MRAITTCSALALAVLFALTSTPTSVVAYCKNKDTVTNVNGDGFFNKCMMDVPPKFGTVLAKNVASYIGPNQSAMIIFFMICLLPFFYFSGIMGNLVRNAHSKSIRAQFRYMRFHLLNLLHRTNYSLCGTVMLYTWFRQRRPCSCPENPGQVGSIYGMPSGDSTHAGIIGAFLIDTAPGHPILSRVFGLLVMGLVGAERISLGWHSLGQVLSGLTLGFVSHYYSTRVPQFMVFVDSAVMALIGLITVNVDPDLQYKDWDDMNIRAWFTQGLGFLLFCNLGLLRHYYTSYYVNGDSAGLKAALMASLYKPPHSPEAGGVLDAALKEDGSGSTPANSGGRGDALLPIENSQSGGGGVAVAASMSDTPTGGHATSNNSTIALEYSDWSFTLWSAVACFAITLIGYMVEQYSTYA